MRCFIAIRELVNHSKWTFATRMLILLNSFYNAAAISRLLSRHSCRATSAVRIAQIELDTTFLLLYYLQLTWCALIHLDLI